MSLLDDFKIASGATEADSYLVNYYLKPALVEAAKVTNNIKSTTLTLSTAKVYDLTSASIASPVVSNGVQDLVYPSEYLEFGKDFYFNTPTSLTFVDTPNISSMEFDYYSYYKTPTGDYTGANDTDADEIMWPAIIRIAKGIYAKDGLVTGAGNGSGVNSRSNVTEIAEANLRVKYGSSSTSSQTQQIDAMINDAKNELRTINGRSLFYQYMGV